MIADQINELRQQVVDITDMHDAWVDIHPENVDVAQLVWLRTRHIRWCQEMRARLLEDIERAHELGETMRKMKAALGILAEGDEDG